VELGVVAVLVARTVAIGDRVRGLGTGGFQGGRRQSGGQARPVGAPLDSVGQRRQDGVASLREIIVLD
jgi:hypothetical protein